MTTVGLVGTGSMGSKLGAGWQAGGSRVVAALVGRSERSRRLAVAVGLEDVGNLDAVVSASDVVVSIVPPGRALPVAADITAACQRTSSQPLVVDFNAVSPATVERVGVLVAEAGCDLVDGAISSGPPAAGDPARVYVCGPVVDLDRLLAVPNPYVDAVRLDGPVGTASALKMCTASMYKGTRALIMQALLTAEAHGVREEFLADTARAWPDDVPTWHHSVAISATKAWRFVDEMHQIAQTQAAAGLPPELFDGVAAAYERAARTALGAASPEDIGPDVTVAEVLGNLRHAEPAPGRTPDGGRAAD